MVNTLAVLVEEYQPQPPSYSKLGALVNSKHIDLGPLSGAHPLAYAKGSVHFFNYVRDPVQNVVYKTELLAKDLRKKGLRKVCERPAGDITDLVEDATGLRDVLVQFGTICASLSVWRTGTAALAPPGIMFYPGSVIAAALLHNNDVFSFKQNIVYRNGTPFFHLNGNGIGFKQQSAEEFTALSRGEKTLLATTTNYRLFDIVNKQPLKTIQKPILPNAKPTIKNDEIYCFVTTPPLLYFAMRQDPPAVYSMNFHAKYSTLARIPLPEDRHVTRLVVVPQTAVDDQTMQKGLF